MRLNRIRLSNFKCYIDTEINFHPKMNVFVGVNGTGKSSILEAIRIAIGSLFLNVDKYKDRIASPGIVPDDVRLYNLEPQYPVKIEADGCISDFANDDLPYMSISWTRTLEKRAGRTTQSKAKEMLKASMNMQKAVREGRGNIPILAYYSTERYKKEKKDSGVIADGSRLRGYYNALDALTNIKFFKDLYYTETLDALQKGEPSIMLQAVSSAVKICVGCNDVYYDIKKSEIILKNSNDELMPMHLLSDGVRSVLSMVMEIAFRCFLLNPHLGADAVKETRGVVLIDEIDLHLHPEWQMHILQDLQKAFPKIQFFVTTHAPIVISTLNDCRIYSISQNIIYDFPLQYGLNADSILEIMGVQRMSPDYQKELDTYMLQIENGLGFEKDAIERRERLNKWLGETHSDLKRADIMLSFFEKAE